MRGGGALVFFEHVHTRFVFIPPPLNRLSEGVVCVMVEAAMRVLWHTTASHGVRRRRRHCFFAVLHSSAHHCVFVAQDTPAHGLYVYKHTSSGCTRLLSLENIITPLLRPRLCGPSETLSPVDVALAGTTLLLLYNHTILRSSVEGGRHITVGESTPRWLFCCAEGRAHTLVATHTQFQLQRSHSGGDTAETHPFPRLLRS